MKNVIFIDNDQSVLKSVMRTYKLNHYSYGLQIIDDAKMAFQKIITRGIDVVIADVSLNGIECKTFYEELIAYDPSIIRISTTADYSIMQSFNDNGQTHITFNKPINTAHLLEWLESLFYYRHGSSKELETFFFGSVKLKSYPEHILNVIEMLKKPDFHMLNLSNEINNDVNLRVKLLKFINSSSFGFARQVTELKEAIEYLGVTNISKVIKYLNVFSIFEKQSQNNPMLKTIPYLLEHKVINTSQTMDLTFIANLLDFIHNEEIETDKNTLNKTAAYIMFVLMVDPVICDAVRFSTEPELCKINNPILNSLVLADYLVDKSSNQEFVESVFGKELTTSLMKGFIP